MGRWVAPSSRRYDTDGSGEVTFVPIANASAEPVIEVITLHDINWRDTDIGFFNSVIEMIGGFAFAEHGQYRDDRGPYNTRLVFRAYLSRIPCVLLQAQHLPGIFTILCPPGFGLAATLAETLNMVGLRIIEC